ncbi:MAG TPA: uroporphyrinogen-III synthase [Puia sp.]|jgi:uroporphyrinogen-III synthase|nr:uroporphyrinogen-III synthase [Puia sp.]
MTRQPIYLLSTGTLPDRLVADASKAGIAVDVVPFIDIEYVDTKNLIPGTAVFTSVNAVIAVKRWLSTPLPNLRIYCISGATHRAVVEAFGEQAVVGKADSAGELANLIRAREPGNKKKIVFFCGDHRREELPALGVTEKIVYRTIHTPHRIQREYDGIAFFSPSAVESFFSVNVIPASIPLFAIGPTTAAAIRAACPNPVITGGEPDKAMLVHQMTDYLVNKQ